MRFHQPVTSPFAVTLIGGSVCTLVVVALYSYHNILEYSYNWDGIKQNESELTHTDF